ncbi:MAG: carboxyl-terminal processing protease [Chloroflexota bacterium]|nr:carboxyl-terminal processing protease [Chloroflexota bacterium]
MRPFARVAPIVVVVCALFLLPFGLGYVVGQHDAAGQPNTPIESWLTRLHLLPLPAERAIASAPSKELDDLFKPFWEAWSYVDSEFYTQSALDKARLEREALRGMVASLGDPYTLFLDPVHREITESDLRGAFDGIGVQVEMIDGRLTVVSPLPGSPGEKAGLKPRDVITHVDGQDISNVSLGDAIRLIRGPRGSTVILTVERDGNRSDLPVERGEVRIAAVTGEMRPDGIAYIRITSFTQRVGADLRQTLDSLAPQRPQGWVLDLRGNPGGYLEGAVAVTSQFVPDGTVLFEEQRDGVREETHTRGQARAADGPMVVLVDKGTASSAEIVAAALRDDGRASLVGEQTFGKGSVQLVHRLSDGSALRITIAHWLTPRAEPINGVGLTPDLAVASVAGTDAVLGEGLDLIRQHIAASGAGPQAQAGNAPAAAVSSPARRASSTDYAPLMDAAAAEALPVGILDSTERAAADPIGLV